MTSEELEEIKYRLKDRLFIISDNMRRERSLIVENRGILDENAQIIREKIDLISGIIKIIDDELIPENYL